MVGGCSMKNSTEPCNLKYFVVLENQTNLISDESGSEDNFTFLVGHLVIQCSENICFDIFRHLGNISPIFKNTN